MNRKFKLPALTLISVLITVYLVIPKVIAAPVITYDNNIFLFEKGEPKSVTFTHGAKNFLLAAIAFEGVVVLGPEGDIVDHLAFDDPLSEATSVTLSDRLTVNNRELIIAAIADEAKFSILLRGLDPDTGKFIEREIIAGDGVFPVEYEPTHLCFARDVYDQSLYLYTGGDHGMLGQYRVFFDSNGKINIRLVRHNSIGGETSSCVADNQAGIVYVVEPEVGLWTIVIDPETDALRHPAAVIKPFGQLSEPLSVTMIYHRNQVFPLIADTGNEAFQRLSVQNNRINATLNFSGVFGRDEVKGSVENIAVGRFPVNGRVQDALAIAIEGDSGGGQIHLVKTGSLGTAINTTHDNSGRTDKIVYPTMATDPVPSPGDAADDPAIWIHPKDPALSLVLGTDKNGGLAVYDLNGKMIQFLADGRMNNVDVRNGFTDIDGLSYIAAATDRTNQAIAIYAIDPDTRQVRRVDARTIPAELYDPYGLCLYRSAQSGNLYVIATSSDGVFNQWRLFPDGAGRVDAELVRRVTVGSVAEGCVADDEAGYLYVAEEDIAIWRYIAEPRAADDRTLIASAGPDGEMTDDIEGVSIYSMPQGQGYLIASSQGSDSYAVYDRQSPHTFRGMFRIRANISEGIDGVSETDGLDVTSVPLPGYPHGLLVVQDGRNIEPEQNQNFKFVSWQDVADALKLEP